MPSVDGGGAGTNYRRGVFSSVRRVFAGRGIALPGTRATVIVVAVAFGLGLAAGWATGFVPDLLRADPSPSPSASPIPSVVASIPPSLPPMPPITRSLNQSDRDAGLTTVDVTVQAEGTFTVVPGVGTPVDGEGEVLWVSVTIEDGVAIDSLAFKTYVITTLNANRGWGNNNTVQFVPTDGVADYRIVVASPYTAAVLCPDPHLVAPAQSVSDAADAEAEAATPSATASPVAVTDSPWSCGQPGVVVISSYDWTAGLPIYGTDYAGARAYLLNHRVGHALGKEHVECVGERADVMVVQDEALPEGCQTNAWPYPDAPPLFVEPSPSPSPVAAVGTA